MAAKSGLDIGMGTLATFGNVGGLILGGGYFLIDSTIGWGNAMHNMNYITNQTRSILGPSMEPLW